MSRALVLGGVAGFLETVLVLQTGIMPPAEIVSNFALLVAAFGGLALVWTVIRRLPILALISADVILLLLAVSVFAVRGCLHNCGDGTLARIGFPLTILIAGLLAFSLLRRVRFVEYRKGFFVVVIVAMTLSALDFAQRDGLQVSIESSLETVLLMLFIASLTTIFVNRRWELKLLWTTLLAAASAVWSMIEVRPLSLATTPDLEQRAVSSAGTPNVLMVVLDTVRADHLGLYGYPRRTSPNLDALAAESVVFERAIASGNYSLPSHASLFTGLLPSQHGAHRRGPDLTGSAASLRDDDYGLAADVETLAERLRKRGYRTGGLSGNYVYLKSWTGLNRGFSGFDDRPLRQIGYHPFSFPFKRRLLGSQYQELVEWDAPAITSAGLAFAKSSSSPFFLFLNYFDAHAPHFARPRFNFREDGIGSDVQPIPPYDSEIAYIDASIKTLVDGLTTANLLDNTILLVVADHGEFFGEKGLQKHRTGGYEPVLHVPLIVRYPKVLKPGKISAPFGILESHRLVMDLIEEKPVDWVRSESDEPKVLAQIWGRVAESDRPGPAAVAPYANIVYSGSFKLIDRVSAHDELYDLKQDPAEENNLLEKPDATVLALKSRMQEAIRKLPPARAGSNPNATASDLAALRGLGYITFRAPGSK